MSHSIEVDWPNERIAVVTFADPARNNQICWAAIDALGNQLRECREAGARVVVLASALEGHWLEHAWLQDLINGVQGLEQTGTGAGWFNTLEELGHESVISIAAISGDCSGGGAELGWGCDIRVAESQAYFSQPEINMGITTGIIVGLIVSLMALLGGKVFPLGGFVEITVPNLLPASWTRFDASFLGLAFNIPLALIVSQFTKAPDPEAVARIHGALDEEFGRRP